MIGLVIAALTYTAPPAWHTRPPASSMRVAEFVIPKARRADDHRSSISARRVGTADANDRWIGQVQNVYGSPSSGGAPRCADGQWKVGD